MKKILCIIAILLLFTNVVYAQSDIDKLIDVANGELGYSERSDGTTKYGEWVGDPGAQWCAEFVCWCVNETDRLYGTDMLNNVYPLYSSRNVGRDWFILRGRYVDRSGNVPEWGNQWSWSDGKNITKNSYVPRPGDLVFFSYDGSFDTSHVALVIDTDMAQGMVHVIEGNNPDKVQENYYPIDKQQILGYGTTYDDIGTTMRVGNRGPAVERLQKQLSAMDLLEEEYINGKYDSHTQKAVQNIQEKIGHTPNAIADYATQKAILDGYNLVLLYNPYDWIVED